MPVLPPYILDADISQWENRDPVDLFRIPTFVYENFTPYSAAQTIKYARSGDSISYDSIGFRTMAAAPVKGKVPLQTILGMKMEKVWDENKQLNKKLNYLSEQQYKIRHRAIDLPPDGRFKFEIRRDTVDFIFERLNTAGRQVEEVWTFSLLDPPKIISENLIDKDFPPQLAQAYKVDIPGGFWLPLTTLVDNGEFKPMQEWRDALSKDIGPGRFYCFVSHRWLTPQHPDPHGLQARFIAWQLFSSLCEAINVAKNRGRNSASKFSLHFGVVIGPSGSELAESLLVNVLRPALDDELLNRAVQETEAFQEFVSDNGLTQARTDINLRMLRQIIADRPLLRFLIDRIYLWYDYSCMPQAPRTPEDEVIFRDGLRYLNAFQVLGRTSILLDEVDDYLSRAWCTLESVFADTQAGFSTDLLVGSSRTTTDDGKAEHYFKELLEDRPHFIWRAVLDTELFRVQSPADCMARLGLGMTDMQDLPFLYQGLKGLRAPVKIHVDDCEIVTGVFPLPVVGNGKKALFLNKSGRSVDLVNDSSPVRTLDWTEALNLDKSWDAQENKDASQIPPLIAVGNLTGTEPETIRNDTCHVAIVAGCEGEAIMFANWVQNHMAELQSTLGVSVVSLSWLATDIAPVGHFAYASLKAVAVDADNWIVLSLETRFKHCHTTGLLTETLKGARKKYFQLSIDVHENNLLTVEPVGAPINNQASARDEPGKFREIDLTAASFPTRYGGLFRWALIDHLI
jgi:hypothetical protein